MELKVGNACPMTSMNVRPNESVEMTFKAPRGKQFVMLFLGVEDKADDGKKIDINARLNELGWEFTDR